VLSFLRSRGVAAEGSGGSSSSAAYSWNEWEDSLRTLFPQSQGGGGAKPPPPGLAGSGASGAASSSVGYPAGPTSYSRNACGRLFGE
jgi:hypothetical protein